MNAPARSLLAIFGLGGSEMVIIAIILGMLFGPALIVGLWLLLRKKGSSRNDR